MKITIHPNFSAEKKYIIRVLMEVYLGLEYSLEFGEEHTYKITLKNGNSLTFADDFFEHFSETKNTPSRKTKEEVPPFRESKGAREEILQNLPTYLHQKNIPKRVRFLKSGFAPLDDIPVIFGNENVREVHPPAPSKGGDERGVPSKEGDTNTKNTSVSPFGGGWGVDTRTIKCGIDVFASSFFMLSRWEELANPLRDAHERFPVRASLAFKGNFLHRAVVNEYIELLWNILTHLGVQQARKPRNFSFLLTHDVDIPQLWRNALSPAKTMLGDIFKRKNKAAIWQHFNFIKKKKDPFDTFDELMDLSENQGLQSHFFFITGGNTRFDNNYEISDFFIEKLITRIHERGHEIGIHPSYDTYQDAAMLSWEIEALRQVSPQSVKTGRQHFLRFAVPHTWQAWEDNGMEWDSTMGYAGAVGFRCGTCYPFPVFNVLTRRELDLVERPLLVMEVSLFSEAYMGLTQAEALVKVQEIVETVSRFEGEFVLLWHNSNLVLNGEDYWETYKAVLAMKNNNEKT